MGRGRVMFGLGFIFSVGVRGVSGLGGFLKGEKEYKGLLYGLAFVF